MQPKRAYLLLALIVIGTMLLAACARACARRAGSRACGDASTAPAARRPLRCPNGDAGRGRHPAG